MAPVLECPALGCLCGGCALESVTGDNKGPHAGGSTQAQIRPWTRMEGGRERVVEQLGLLSPPPEPLLWITDCLEIHFPPPAKVILIHHGSSPFKGTRRGMGAGHIGSRFGEGKIPSVIWTFVSPNSCVSNKTLVLNQCFSERA